MTNNEILYGAAYYDEYMPYDRIKTDMQMMKDAGYQVVETVILPDRRIDMEYLGATGRCF